MTDLDGIARALSDGSRRRILMGLCDKEQFDPFSGGRDSGETDMALRHVHLPLLEDDGLVTWDRDRNTVGRGDNFDAVEPVLTALEAHRDELPDGYLSKAEQRC